MDAGEGVPSGPFEREPVDLGRALSDGFSADVPGDEIVRRCEQWLTAELGDAGVVLGAFDAEVAALLAADGWSVAQVVAGWVRRAAAQGAPGTSASTSASPRSPGRSSDART